MAEALRGTLATRMGKIFPSSAHASIMLIAGRSASRHPLPPFYLPFSHSPFLLWIGHDLNPHGVCGRATPKSKGPSEPQVNHSALLLSGRHSIVGIQPFVSDQEWRVTNVLEVQQNSHEL